MYVTQKRLLANNLEAINANEKVPTGLLFTITLVPCLLYHPQKIHNHVKLGKVTKRKSREGVWKDQKVLKATVRFTSTCTWLRGLRVDL